MWMTFQTSQQQQNHSWGKIRKSTKYFEPTIVEVSSAQDKILDYEIFGPILPIMTYGSDDELDSILQRSKNH